MMTVTVTDPNFSFLFNSIGNHFVTNGNSGEVADTVTDLKLFGSNQITFSEP